MTDPTRVSCTLTSLTHTHTHRLPPPMRAAAVDSAPVGDGTAATEQQPGPGSQRRNMQGLSAERVQRLETLVELKKLYRNLIRAEALLALPSPVYTPPEGVRQLDKGVVAQVVRQLL